MSTKLYDGAAVWGGVVISIDVIGTPAPKGSKRAFRSWGTGKVVIIDDNAPAKRSWHQAVVVAAREAMRGKTPFVGVPLRVSFLFMLRRPQGHYGKKGLRPTAPPRPSVKPDLDKLVRNSADPLEGVVFDGDSRIVEIVASKFYAPIGTPEGATIQVMELTC